MVERRTELPPIQYAVRKMVSLPEVKSRGGEASPFFIFVAGSDEFEESIHSKISTVAKCKIDREGDASLISGLAELIQKCCRPVPPAHFYAKPLNQRFPGSYIPRMNLYPSMGDFLSAHAAAIEALISDQGAGDGNSARGLISRSWPFDAASYLRLIFPSGKFLFLIQNPLQYLGDTFSSSCGKQEGELGPWIETQLEHWIYRCVAFSHVSATPQSFVTDHGSVIADPEVRYQVAKLLELQVPWQTREHSGPDLDELEKMGGEPGVFQSASWGRFAKLSVKLGYPLPRRIIERIQQSSRIDLPQPDSQESTVSLNSASQVEKTRSRCVILVPSLNQVLPPCEQLLGQLENLGYRVFRRHGIASVDVARNLMISEALEGDFDEFLWIDDDTVFPLDVVDKVRAHGLPLVGGLVAKKASRSFASMLNVPQDSLKLGIGGGLVEAVQIGTGFLLTHRCVYDAILRNEGLEECTDAKGRKFRPFFLPHVREVADGHWYLAEDYSFVEKAKNSGFKPLVDTSLRIGHLGLYDYGWEDVAFGRKKLDSLTYEL